MRQRIIGFTFFLCLCFTGMQAQEQLLQSGPMAGYSAMREVMLWVQTNAVATVHFEYWVVGAEQTRWKTASYTTNLPEAYTAHIKADEVTPGKKYQYELFINGTKVPRPYPLQFQSQTLWQFRTDPPTFKFAFGSCNFVSEALYDRPGEPYGGGYEIFQTIADRKPAFMLWGGDNTYMREVDWDSETGIMKRNTHTRSLPEMQALLGGMHHYAIWDDHDFGANNSDGTFWNKELTEKAFKLFWANPNYGLSNGKGITGTFYWEDVQFFLLDNRYFRTPMARTTGDRYILGETQEEWLISSLKSSEAPFKFVVLGGQFISMVSDKENHAQYAEERNRILQRLREEKIEGVIFLTGDRHHTVLSKLQESNFVYPLYDFTVSPLTSGCHEPSEDNILAVPKTLVVERNFAEMEVTGPRLDRKLTVTVFNVKGKRLWDYSIEAKELKYK